MYKTRRNKMLFVLIFSKILSCYYIMKKIIIFLIISLNFLCNYVYADSFIAQKNGKVLKEDGNVTKRESPCSTFKIAISLMGFNEKILKNEVEPILPFKKGYVDYSDSWKTSQNPMTWIKNSCIWYSQIITTTLGIEKFKKYVKGFNYGNKNISGKHKLKNSWLCGGSLKISAKEQVDFLEKFLRNDLPVTKGSLEMTKKILFIEDIEDGWKLSGKTGSGLKNGKKLGWFVGWIQKDDCNIGNVANCCYNEDIKNIFNNAA